MFGSLIKICIAHFHKFSKPKTTHIMQSAQFCNWHLSQLWDTAGLHLSKLDLPKSCLWIYLMKVTHNSSFVHQPRDIMVDWAKTNKQAEFEFPTSKKKKKWARGEGNMWPNAKETAYCWGLWLGAGVPSIFFCLAWPGTDHSPAPDTIDHTVVEREWGRDEWMRWGRGGMVPFITMVTNGTINHSTPPQLSSHPQSERQSLGPGLLEQHGH